MPFGDDPWAGCATTSGPSAPSSPPSPPARRPLREHALQRHPDAAVLQPGTRRRRPRPRRSISAGCSGGPAPWPARWPTASSPTPPTRTRATCETCLPALAEGARAAGRDLRTGRFRAGHRHPGHHRSSSERPCMAERERQRRLLAFLYSTPAYAPPWSSTAGPTLGPRLRDLIRHEQWDDLGRPSSPTRCSTPWCRLRDLRRAPRPAARPLRAAWARASSCRRPPTTGDDDAFAEGHRLPAMIRRLRSAAGSARHGEDESSSAMARSPRGARVAQRGVAVGRVQDTGQERRCRPGCRTRGRPAWTARSGCRGRCPRRWRPARTTSRPSARRWRRRPRRRRPRTAVGPGPLRHRLDGHDPEVALGADGQQLLGRLAVLGRAHKAG